ncbi:lysosomal proton-coupled steroid conjugate and bile acid symporter SLC46A3-like [Macrobrachium nipponense]|uniref:lysosomal proton-coupled steroid conjugate and bile acid symporter SLC46A3-like n=1 Tax=Macrobrachium nipponense TaxID=159736 RepID=UPI0030C85B59
MPVGERTPLIPSGRHDNSDASPSRWSSVKGFLRTITVEPALCMFFLGYGMENVFITNLWIDKICRFHFNYSDEVCRALDSGKYPEEQTNVQKTTTVYNVYAHVLQYLPAVFVVLLLGTWSDKRGRRLPIIVPFLGYFLTSLSVTAVSYFWALPPTYLLLAYLPLAFTGGLMGVYAGVYPYLTAVTTQRARTTRISILAVVILSSGTIGIASGIGAFKHFGYVGVFGSQAILIGCSIVYSLLVLKERPEDDIAAESPCSEGVLHVLSPSYLKETLLVAFKKRSGGKRGDILGHIVIMMIMVFIAGSYKYIFLYTRKKFQWDEKMFSIYAIVDTPLSALGMLTVLPYLSYRWKVEDGILGLMGGISLLFSNVMKATAPAPWVMFLASVVGMCLDQVTAASRGAVSKLVDKSEVGAVFAVLGAAEAMIPIASVAVYTYVYNATIGFFPGMIFVFTAALSLVICCIYVWIMTRQRRQPTDDDITSSIAESNECNSPLVFA